MGGATSSKTLGRYELVCEVAKGQLGPLWVARSAGGEDTPPVLIRRVPTGAGTSSADVDGLSEGAWWMLELNEEGIAKGLDVVKTEGELGIVTEFFEGEILRSLLRLSSFKRKPIPAGVGVRVAVDVLEALDRAAREGGTAFALGGLVPDSVLVAKDGRSRLLDIGIAGPAARVGAISRHPEMAAYASPEQLDDPQNADMRANIYSVAVMLWEMLAGKRMFVGSTHQAVSEKVKAGGIQRLDATKPVGGEALSAALADVVAKMLATSAGERPATIEQAIEALRGAQEPATYEQVAALVEDFAGNAIASRTKLIDKAAHPAAAPAPKVAMKAPEPARAPAPAAAPKPGGFRTGKSTLLGIAPAAVEPKVTAKDDSKPDAAAVAVPDARPQLESLDSEELESVVESVPAGFNAAEPPSAEPVTQPKPAEPTEQGSQIKTQFLGMAPDPKTALAAAAEEAKAGSPKPPKAESPKPPAAAAKDEPEKAKGAAMDVPPPPAGLWSETDAVQAKDNAEDPIDVEIGGPSVPPPADEDEEAEEKEEEPKKAEPKEGRASPPGLALDAVDTDEPVRSVASPRTERNRKIVGAVVGGLVLLTLIGIFVSQSGSKTDAGEGSTTSTAAAARTGDTPKAEEPKAEEPKAEEPKAEEPKAEEPKAEEPKAEEPKAEEPKPVAEKPTTTTKPTTTWKPATKPVTKPTTTKPKPKYTPSGI